MKRRFLLLAGLAGGLLATPSSLLASADDSCSPQWRLDGRDLGCNSRSALAPGNDTRANLLLLIRDRAGVGTAGLSYPKAEWEERGYGRTFFDWKFLTATYYPQPEDGGETPDFTGSRCVSVTGTNGPFEAALRAAKGLSEGERTGLTAARTRLAQACREEGALAPWPDVSSAAGQEFLAYLKAAEAFYSARWPDATQGFAALAGARDSWIKETAIYMTGRTALNVAQDKAFDDWGGFAGKDKIDQPTVAAARKALEAYLKAWPKGRYAQSARGLVRRTMWLSGDLAGLAGEYERAAGLVDARTDAAVDLVDEVDDKYLMSEGADGTATGPLLMATQDLLAMRATGANGEAGKPLPLARLESQKAAFAGHEDLYGFLLANHAYYVAGDMKKVLALLPDDARRPSYTPLAFSRQVLRGMALAALGDPNTAGFWRELIGGSAAMHQRPLAELGLAMSLERSGKLADVFAPGSLVQDATVREVLLGAAAGPEVLRAVARDTARSEHERDFAAFALLHKELSRGRYAAFAADTALVRKGATTATWFYNFATQDEVPAGVFVRGKYSDGFACPAIAKTALVLAATPNDSTARLCLGDFLRLNGFDNFTDLDTRPDKGELGGVANQFPGKAIGRGAIYAAIMADKGAPAEARAYAMYRAIACYAPAGYNSCGGTGVDIGVRKAWYNQLKKEYPTSPWAKKLRYWW